MLIILTTHPIQYQVPLWQALARNGHIPFEVWYLTDAGVNVSHDREFDKAVSWDIDLLSGYTKRFLEVPENVHPSSFWSCRLTEDISKRLRQSNVKVLWIQGWRVMADWQALWAAKRVGAEVWIRGEGNDLALIPLWKRAIKRVILGQLFRRVDRFLYIGKANRRLYENFGVAKERLYPAPYAVDNDRFARQANAIRNQRSEIRSHWKIPEDAFCVLFCGKFIPKKRPLDLIKAAQLLLQSSPELKVHLLFVGSGEVGLELRVNCNVVFDADASPPINREQITDNLRPAASFPGFLNQTQVSRAYVAADCLVLPSDYGETWGLVVNEAMASGLRCIISDRCGCAEDLGKRRPNDVFVCGNIRDLSERICRMARDDRAPARFDTLPSFEETVATAGLLYSALKNAKGSENE